MLIPRLTWNLPPIDKVCYNCYIYNITVNTSYRREGQDMLLSINEQDPRPVYVQIVNQIKDQIQRGSLEAGDELPSVRELAASLGINMHTVRRAYVLLRDQKLLVFRLGQQAKVAALRSQPASTGEVTRVLGERLQELITEAFLLGLSPADFHKLVEAQMAKLKEEPK
jgi:GntR family transcriptional regulator